MQVEGLDRPLPELPIKTFSLPALELHCKIEQWPIKAGGFTISRGTKTEADVIVVKLTDGTHFGWAECVPYRRYGEELESVKEQIGTVRDVLGTSGQTIDSLNKSLPAGAARNVLDCALWDFICKSRQARAYKLAGIDKLLPQQTAYTISLGSPEKMASDAQAHSHLGLLKIKLGGSDDGACMLAIQEAVPNARLIADANEGWTASNIEEMLDTAYKARFELIEQPLPSDADELLCDIQSPVPICADESIHVSSDLEQITKKYEAINIKLDKTGGLTEALSLLEQAQQHNLKIMVGCMVGTSLAMAPAILLAQFADWVDLDGPLLLDKDREPGLVYEGDMVYLPETVLWG